MTLMTNRMGEVAATGAPDEAIAFGLPANRWSDAEAQRLSPAELLLYRSRLLGADLTVTNFGGGNTSAKFEGTDPLTGETVEVLWVKGSGGDLGSMGLDGFATLYLDRLRRLEALYHGPHDEDRMVGYLPHCTFNLNPRAASIDTPLHAFLPARHVDHVHPDAVIALAASTGGRDLARQLWGDRIGWIPWRRPGFELGLAIRDFALANPGAEGAILAGHGLICWAESARACYDLTIGLVRDAAEALNLVGADRRPFGGRVVPMLEPAERRARALALAPRLRAAARGARPKLVHFTDDPETMAFVDSADCGRLAVMGTSCPDHFLRTKIAPLLLEFGEAMDDSLLEASFADYRDRYRAYHARHAGPDDPPVRDPNPVIVLVPGVGRFALAADRGTARIASEFYGNAISVMRGAEAIGQYVGLPEDEAFRIEYWALEEAKLRRMPPPRPLVGRIALITGAAGGIGAATARRFLEEGCCVMLTDHDTDALAEVHAELASRFPGDLIASASCDVTDEASIAAAFEACVLAFGGLDILVANAGIASSAPIEDTSLALWRKNYDVLVDGYFLAARAAFPLLRRSGEGSIVFIGSKNALAATPNASAYASAKAASLHLARCLALEGAGDGIRVNVVNPDAVIRGSRIWSGDWRQERASAHGVAPGEELEDYYRKRSMLQAHVLPEDVAEAVLFFATDRSGKSTGNVLNVDAGNAQAFTR